MKLKDLEACMLVLNNAAQGGFIVDESTGELISKNSIEHFAIIHANKNLEELNDGILPKKRKYTRKKETNENDQLAEQANYEDDDDELGRNEEKAYLPVEKELRIIAMRRKINQPSISKLADDGWFICPIYQDITGLRPLYVQILERKKGYRIVMASKPIFMFANRPFRKDNLKDWSINSIFILNNNFDRLSNNYGLYAESIFIHKKIDRMKYNLKAALSRLETTQKSRIRLGNILTDENLVAVGQERYITNKEKIALLTKKDKKKAEDLKDYDLKEVKTIDMIYQSYNKINKKAEELGKKVPINREDTFETVLKAVKEDDANNHILMAGALTLSRLAENGENVSRDELPMKGSDDFDKNLKIFLQRYEGTAEYKKAYEDTDILNTADYISNYITYINTKIYANAFANENDAKTVVTKLVHETVLWEFAKDVSGLGEVPCAYLEANIDWRAATHPSSIIRYLGLDNVIEIPKRKDKKGNEILMQDNDVKRYVEMINLDLARKFAMKKENGIDEFSRETFDTFLKTDTIDTYDDFLTAIDFYKAEFGGLHIAEKEEKLENLDVSYITDNYPKYADMLARMWNSFDIVYTSINGNTVPAIKKRARHKGDWVISPYIDKNGKVKFKKSMGYNPKVKSRIVEIAFESISKAKNKYYFLDLYNNRKKQYIQRCISQGKDPEDFKMTNHLRARRFAVQVLLEDIWKHMRISLGLPLNGGTYYEAKLHGSHGHGFDPAIIA